MPQEPSYDQLSARSRNLHQPYEHYCQILDNTSDMISTHDADGKCLYVTPSCHHFTGYQPCELIGKNICDFLHLDDLKVVRQNYQKILTGKNIDSFFYRIRHKDGSFKWVETTSKGIQNKKTNKIDQIIANTRDITKQKKLEKELQHKCKMKSISTLAGGLAHDINNILYVIVGNAELALEDIPKWHPVHSNMENIRSAGLRAASVVSQLLQFTCKAKPVLVPVDCMALIEDIFKKLRTTIASSIGLQTHFQCRQAMVLADKGQVKQCLLAICKNACQAMEKTGGNLNVRVEKIKFSENIIPESLILEKEDYLKILIQDTGTGIAPEIIDQVFDPYFTTKDVGEGSGMGLAVACCIVANHSGKIIVDSEVGKGCTFAILLPLAFEKPTVETE